jgi:membrane-bound serine protease (ClpP class)
MRRFIPYLLFWFFMPFPAKGQVVISMKIDGTINPVAASYIHNGVAKAQKEKAECLIIHLNTPGGLLKSTRSIVSDLLESTVPVIVYVSPAGSQCGSAGVFIALAANIAAMAPGTNIGAAHPVTLQGMPDSIMAEKVTNDAAAFIHSIAEKRKRNSQWAEDAVRKSLSITETEALKENVIDLIARDDQDLLNQLEGKEIVLSSGTVTLHTRAAPIEQFEMSFSEKLLDIISDPNITYLLMMLGFFGILFELYNPGAILPGIVGVIALVMAFYAMQSLPVNYAGLALIVFAIILFILEIKVVSHGLLAIGGVASMLLGSLMLIRTSSALEFARISRGVIISATLVTALFFLFVIGLGLKAQRRKVVTGREGLVGITGQSITALSPSGTVRVHGEIWNAESVSGNIAAGESVRIIEMKNLKLFVEPISS